MLAKIAKALVKKSEAKRLNYQRRAIIARIAEAAKNGNSFVILDQPHIVLFEADYAFFESLGYTVYRPETKTLYHDSHNLYMQCSAGRIDW
jgi:hypothetical protein